MTLRGFVACLILVLAAGCALAPRFQEPQLDLIDLQMLRGDLLQQELRVRLLVRNPNPRELVVRGIQYRVKIAGEDFGHGESERDFTVPANGETEFDASLKANTAAMVLRLLGSGRRLDAIDYQVSGTVMLAKGMKRNISFDRAGQFKLR
jgi:LEA14-like dessication related protein